MSGGDCGIELTFHIALAPSANELVQDFAALEDDERGDAHDVVVPRDDRVFVDVHLHDFYFSLVLFLELLDDRQHRFARPAPRRPEIHKDWERGLEDIGIEGGVGDGITH